MQVANRIILVLIAVALLAAGGWAIAESVAHLASQDAVLLDPGTVAATLEGATWTSTTTRLVAIGLVVVGLGLVIAQLKPRRPVDYPSQGASATRHLSYERHGLARLAGQIADDHPDVAAVDGVELHRRNLRVTARGYVDTSLVATRRDVEQRVQDGLAGLDLKRPPRVRVAVVAGDRRTR